MNQPVPAIPQTSDQPEGLGGWLILPIIGLFLTPVNMVFTTATNHLPILTDGTWEALTTPGSESYHRMWGPTLVYEIGANVAFLLYAIAILVPMFMKLRFFPGLMVIFYVANFLSVVVDEYLFSLLPEDSYEDALAGSELVQPLVAAAIWIPYFLVSKRVKNTFVY